MTSQLAFVAPTATPDPDLLDALRPVVEALAELPEAERVATLNELRRQLHTVSPFAGEPVDCVRWVQADRVVANDYNPNAVAPPEMVLLELSVAADGFTQPIVGWQLDDDLVEVVDGFHRTRVGKESTEVRGRLHGYLPVAIINGERTDRSDRIAATIRHNRARGKHRIQGMADIVLELKRRNWSDDKIGRELGMEPDEVLRLAQITGLAEMFSDREFSVAWEAEVIREDEDSLEIEDEAPLASL